MQNEMLRPHDSVLVPLFQLEGASTSGFVPSQGNKATTPEVKQVKLKARSNSCLLVLVSSVVANDTTKNGISRNCLLGAETGISQS